MIIQICRELKASRGDWTTYWDDKAKVPYMRNGNKWVSFENPDSIKEKVSHISQHLCRLFEKSLALLHRSNTLQVKDFEVP